MSSLSLKFLSEATLSELRSDVTRNIDRYVSGNFLDLELRNGWAIESVSVEIDLSLLARLKPSRGVEGEAHNSTIVYQALAGLTPALAMEERIWVRLTHVECLDYARARWLVGVDREDLPSEVHTHMFARGRTGCRDDNAIGRLWWNMHIAHLADPEDPTGALRLLVLTADIRKGIIERPGIASRKPLIQAIVRALRRHSWLTSGEKPFREFMKVLNRDCGGLLFEVLDDQYVDRTVDLCVARAKKHLS